MAMTDDGCPLISRENGTAAARRGGATPCTACQGMCCPKRRPWRFLRQRARAFGDLIRDVPEEPFRNTSRSPTSATAPSGSLRKVPARGGIDPPSDAQRGLEPPEQPRVCRRPRLFEDGVMEAKKKTSNKFSPEVRARAVRTVQERRGDHASQWAAMVGDGRSHDMRP